VVVPSRRSQIRTRKAWVRTLLAEDPEANRLTLWSDLGYALNRWSATRVGAAVSAAQGRNAMGQVLARLLREPQILHLPRRAA
jgi:hypothetical protein